MANTRSALRDIKKSRARALRNQEVRSAIKTSVKKTRVAIAEGSAQALELYRDASSLVDRAAKRNIIHRNAAARRKSRLARQLNAARAAAQGAAD